MEKDCRLLETKQGGRYDFKLSAAVSDTITLIEWIHSHSGQWYAGTDQASAFFIILIEEQSWNQFTFTWQGWQYTFTHLPQGYVPSPTICQWLGVEHLDHMEMSDDVKISYYIDDIMIQGPTEETVLKL